MVWSISYSATRTGRKSLAPDGNGGAGLLLAQQAELPKPRPDAFWLNEGGYDVESESAQDRDDTQYHRQHGTREQAGKKSAKLSRPAHSHRHHPSAASATTSAAAVEASTNLGQLLEARAEENTVVLLGFNYGYKHLLLNALCRFAQLGVHNYLIAAFEPEAMIFCRERKLPCFDVTSLDEDNEAPVPSGPLTQEAQRLEDAQIFGSPAFQRLTKLKSRQTLRLLERGYNVLWADVDIFFKRNPLATMRDELDKSKVDIVIQSDAKMRRRPNAWINSGFYLARPSDATVRAFRGIVAHAAQSSESEQPSFQKILCETRRAGDRCINRRLGVQTLVLERKDFPNGSMKNLLAKVRYEPGDEDQEQEEEESSDDNVVIVHFNYRKGIEEKINSFVQSGMWLLRDDLTCISQDAWGNGGRERGKRGMFS